MFKHILLPTDGSPLSSAAVRRGMALAKQCGATVTGLHIMPEFHVLSSHSDMLEATRGEFERVSTKHAKLYLDEVEELAREIGVLCKTAMETSDQPYEVIIRVAKEHGCDLICMASHGRRGVKGLLLGSETHKVLTHSQIPVLVYR